MKLLALGFMLWATSIAPADVPPMLITGEERARIVQMLKDLKERGDALEEALEQAQKVTKQCVDTHSA